jgi:hypothetical protein
MAGKLTYVGAGYALDIVTGRAAGPGARTEYLELLTVAPTAASTLASVTEYAPTGGYSRQAMAMGAPAGTPRATANTGARTFGPFTGTVTGTVAYWLLTSAASTTTGDALAYGDFTSSRTPAVGDSLSVAIGAITVSID